MLSDVRDAHARGETTRTLRDRCHCRQRRAISRAPRRRRRRGTCAHGARGALRLVPVADHDVRVHARDERASAFRSMSADERAFVSRVERRALADVEREIARRAHWSPATRTSGTWRRRELRSRVELRVAPSAPGPPSRTSLRCAPRRARATRAVLPDGGHDGHRRATSAHPSGRPVTAHEVACPRPRAPTSRRTLPARLAVARHRVVDVEHDAATPRASLDLGIPSRGLIVWTRSGDDAHLK